MSSTVVGDVMNREGELRQTIWSNVSLHGWSEPCRLVSPQLQEVISWPEILRTANHHDGIVDTAGSTKGIPERGPEDISMEELG